MGRLIDQHASDLLGPLILFASGVVFAAVVCLVWFIN